MYRIVHADQLVFRHDPWKTVKDFVETYNLEGAINFGFFHRTATHPVGSKPTSMVAWDGKSAVDHGYSHGWWDSSIYWVGVIKYKDGTVNIEFSPESWIGHRNKLASIDWAVSAGPIILYNGFSTIFQANKFPGVNVGTRVQRVAIGITEDQRVIIAYLEHATALEMANYLRKAGAIHGILGDGGSSASYVDGSTSYGNQLVPNVIGWSREKETETMTTIYIDAGHGGTDPGAVGNGLQEKDVNLFIALELQKLLAPHCKVLMARTTDQTVANSKRTLESRNAGADLYLSIHSNGHPDSAAAGYEDFIHNNAGAKSIEVQKILHPYAARPWTSRNRPNRGKKRANFQVLRETGTSILIESGFITNADDAGLLKDPGFLREIARDVFVGLSEIYGFSVSTDYRDALIRIRNIVDDTLSTM